MIFSFNNKSYLINFEPDAINCWITHEQRDKTLVEIHAKRLKFIVWLPLWEVIDMKKYEYIEDWKEG